MKKGTTLNDNRRNKKRNLKASERQHQGQSEGSFK